MESYDLLKKKVEEAADDIANVGFLGFTRCDQTSFRSQVVPGDNFYTLCKLIERNRRRFVCQVQGVVNYKLVFESTITGMKL